MATLAERLVNATAWAMVLILAAFIVLTVLHVGHGSSLFAADERLARAIASPFKIFDGIGLRHGWM
jgi:hypothetical protein